MSNLPPNPYNNMPGPAQVNANPGGQFNHNQQYGQVPLNQLPPGYGGLKQDLNSNSPQHGPTSVHNNIQNVNNYNQSANSSPAFNQPGMMHLPPTSLQSSPMRPPPSSAPGVNPMGQAPLSSGNPRLSTTNPNPSYPPNYQPQHQINDNAPPLIPTSQFSQPLMNGPPLPVPSTMMPPNQFPVSSSYTSPPVNRPPVSAAGFVPGPIPPYGGPRPTPMATQPNVPFSAAPTGPPRNSPLPTGLPASGPQSLSGPPGNLGPPRSTDMINGPHPSPSIPAGPTGQPSLSKGPAMPGMNAPTMGLQSGPIKTYPGQQNNGPTGPSQPRAFTGPMGPPNALSGPPNTLRGPPNTLSGPPVGPQSLPPMGPQSLPPMASQMAPPLSGPPGPSRPIGPPGPYGQPEFPGPPQVGPPKTSMQSRYPQMPQSSYTNQQPNQMPQQPSMKQYPQQYNAQNLNQQMGQLSVTNQGFDALWGHQMVDLLNCKHILPEYPDDPAEIKLGHQFAESPNCSPDIFRCTVNRIPETNSLLQKSRLPLGILIHPFKDLNHLPVIQCTSIVRCRSCRTYINPFVYFVDAKRWKCNLCYRVNDLPEEFQYDPVSKSYGDPSRRPEIKSATIEFIAPGEYMLRPPQPAVYLFLFDVSQLARDSGYLQVACDTLKANLDQLPGDARTQIGFICFDAHVHYYLMSDGLTRPKEMTVLDIEEVFLPSPEALLVNLGERMELVREVLGVLPARHAAAGARGGSACALGAALQAAYKLMAPTGGRITVFQTCLPNIGPGALPPREDPNARSSKEVAHLAPATDFYKRLALDCSGAQVAVDLFLLNSQYSDLATLSGMSKFSAGTVYHMPLFRGDRAWQADQLARMFTRYLTRKIGFEAVMRVRCTRGIAIHTFHGNFFVRSTDLLSLPNVSPDAGFGMQLTVEESLADLQQVCFQAALLYTSSKGERRIRVHTLALPTASTLPDVLHSADQYCIIGLLSKMAVDRCVTASMSEAREAVMNVAVDALSAHRLAANLPLTGAPLCAPMALRLLPLYLHALLKRKAFRTGTSTRLDDRVADMCALKTEPLSQLLRGVYPDLYPVHALHDHLHDGTDEDPAPDPPRLQLSAVNVNMDGAYLLDDGETMILYVCSGVSPAYLSDTFGLTAFGQLPDETRSVPRLSSPGNTLLHAFVDKLNDERPHASNILILRDNSPSRQLFTDRLVDDRVESSLSYYEFLQHVKSQLK